LRTIGLHDVSTGATTQNEVASQANYYSRINVCNKMNRRHVDGCSEVLKQEL